MFCPVFLCLDTSLDLLCRSWSRDSLATNRSGYTSSFGRISRPVVSRASPMPFSSLLVDPLDLLPFDFGRLAFEWPHRRGKPVLDLLAPFRDAEQFAIGRAQPARFSAESIGGELEQLLIRRQARRKLTKHLVASKPAAVQKSYSNLHGITCEKPNLLLRVSQQFFFLQQSNDRSRKDERVHEIKTKIFTRCKRNS